MNFSRSLILISALLLNSAISAQKWSEDDFAIPLSKIVNQPNQIYVSSGFTTVKPWLYTLCGVQDFYSPPYAAQKFQLAFRFSINGKLLPDNGAWGGMHDGILYSRGTWYPGHIRREGMYNKNINESIVRVQITSDLLPLADKPGFLVKIKIRNKGSQPVSVYAVPEMTGGNPAYKSLGEWGFSQPYITDTARRINDTEWSSGTASLKLYKSKEYNTGNLDPGETADYSYAVIISSLSGKAGDDFDFIAAELKQREAWTRRIEKYLSDVPLVKSNIPGLDKYYNRSVLSALVCIWENPSFFIQPYLSSLAMDGGGFNCYLWDFGYSANMLALMLGDEIKPLVKQFMNVDLGKYYSYTPAGTGTGVSYSYSTFSFMNIIWALARHSGPDKLLIEDARSLIENLEMKPQWNNLIDFGNQHNLLEMRTDGWEHYVASPNAERVWCLRRLSDLNDLQGGAEQQSTLWRTKADQIQASIKEKLWDPDAGWFRCIYPDGHPEMVYSIQGFDPLQMGVCDEEMKAGLLRHLRTGEFLFDYGASSVSAADSMHFEFNDPDWGGSGAYTGDTPQLSLLLYGLKRPDLGFDVLKRLFWMGEHLPYYPQEHYCERMAVPSHKRANTISGLLGSEVILYGMAGLDPRIDGTLWINPQMPAGGEMTVRGYGWKRHTIDIDLKDGRSKVYLDGKAVYSGKNRLVRLH
ncbi:MAG TPA: hypothetical protein PL123_04955 [Bacteroidales bacterium]|nr:hypothetical protein [Bacteroidales bacterium]